MRDIILVTVTAGMLLWVLKSPVWGAYLWAWYSLMNPHKLTYNFASSLPFAQVIALVTMAMFVFARVKRGLPPSSVVTCWLLLLFWMSVTSVFALNTQDLVLERWIFVMKIQLMLLVTLMLVVDGKQLRILVMVVTLSVAFYGIKGGFYTLSTGGSGRVWGPQGTLLEGNNELAVGLVMLVPYMHWMRQTLENKWAKRALLAGMVLCVLSILGTQSRGALLAVVAMAAFLGLKSAKPVRTTLLIGVCLLVAIASMPESWTNRMDTIGTYEQDQSAMSRIWTWTTLWNTALDRPLVGAGFRADSRIVFDTYAPKGGEWSIFSGTVLVAHSIYFQMLGEHGFIGLGLFVALWLSVWRLAGRVGKRAAELPELAPWLPLLMRMTQVSVVGYFVGGAFLSLAYLDLVFYFMGYAIIADRMVREGVRGHGGKVANVGQSPAWPPASQSLKGER